jgi:hypothetical protein
MAEDSSRSAHELLHGLVVVRVTTWAVAYTK